MQDLLFPELIFWGFFSGFMGGLLGVGGGLVFVLVIPPAARALGIPESEIMAVTIANSLACTFFTTFSAGISRFLREKEVRRAASIIGLCSTVVSLLLLKFLVNPGLIPPLFFHGFFLIIVLYLIIRLFLRWNMKKNGSVPDPVQNDSVLWLAGLFSGIVSPLSGLGGGIVVVPLLHAILHFPIRLAQGISFGVIAISTLASSIFNILETTGIPDNVSHQGLLVLPLIINLGLTAVPGSLLGSLVSSRLSSKVSSGILLLFLLFIFIRKISTLIWH